MLFADIYVFTFRSWPSGTEAEEAGVLGERGSQSEHVVVDTDPVQIYSL